MSRYIMNDMVYDTEKAEKICSGHRREPLLLLGAETGRFYNSPIDLYRTNKGNYFCVHTGDYDRAGTLPEEEAKNIMKHYAYKRFCELYGALPEA